MSFFQRPFHSTLLSPHPAIELTRCNVETHSQPEFQRLQHVLQRLASLGLELPAPRHRKSPIVRPRHRRPANLLWPSVSRTASGRHFSGCKTYRFGTALQPLSLLASLSKSFLLGENCHLSSILAAE